VHVRQCIARYLLKTAFLHRTDIMPATHISLECNVIVAVRIFILTIVYCWPSISVVSTAMDVKHRWKIFGKNWIWTEHVQIFLSLFHKQYNITPIYLAFKFY
jgi:hypothetical protein